MLALARVSKNIEIVLLCVGVVYGDEECHLLPHFKKAFDNQALSCQEKKVSGEISTETDGTVNKSVFSKMTVVQTQSKTREGAENEIPAEVNGRQSGPHPGPRYKHTSNLRNKSEAKVETGLQAMGLSKVGNDNFIKFSKSGFELSESGALPSEPLKGGSNSTSQNLAVVNVRKISQCVSMLCKEELSLFVEDGGVSGTDLSRSGQNSSSEMGRNPSGLLAFRYSKKQAKMYFSYKRGELDKENRTEDFNVEMVHGTQDESSQSATQESESIKRDLVNGKDMEIKQGSSGDKTSEGTEEKEKKEEKDLQSRKSEIEVETTQIGKVMGEKGVTVTQQQREYFEYIEYILGNI